MQHQHYDLKHIDAGRVVEVALGSAANVRIMDHASYQDFIAGNRCRFIGGHVTSSPFRATIPTTDHWHVIVDLGGEAGVLKSGVRVLPGYLPPPSAKPLLLVPSLNLGRQNKEQDVFILHVAEDKAMVRFFAFALRKTGLKVAYDEYELHADDDLYSKAKAGINDSSCGIVIMSRSLIKQGWVEAGIGDLAVKAFSGKQVLLPVWHDITRNEVIEFCPGMANLAACNTAVSTLEEIADDIAGLVTLKTG